MLNGFCLGEEVKDISFIHVRNSFNIKVVVDHEIEKFGKVLFSSVVILHRHIDGSEEGKFFKRVISVNTSAVFGGADVGGEFIFELSDETLWEFGIIFDEFKNGSKKLEGKVFRVLKDESER